MLKRMDIQLLPGLKGSRHPFRWSVCFASHKTRNQVFTVYRTSNCGIFQSNIPEQPKKITEIDAPTGVPTMSLANITRDSAILLNCNT